MPESVKGLWGAEHVHFRSCGSTMEEAQRLAREGAAHGTLVTADEQTEGRGRRGRSWFSPKGAGLSLSVVLRPPLEPRSVPPITLAAGVAVCDAVNTFGAGASLKWPNDVFVGAKKMAGILTEMSSNGPTLDHVIVGVGLNVASVPGQVSETSTSLADVSNEDVSMGKVLSAVASHLASWFDRFFEGGVAAIAAACRSRAILDVRVASDSPRIEGVAADIADDGTLVVQDHEGRRHFIVAGELEWEFS